VTESEPVHMDTGADVDAESTGSEQQGDIGRLTATVTRLQEKVQQAQATADGRALVEMAKGILIERLHCGPAEAARQLADLADSAGISPLELAVDIVNQAAQDRLSGMVQDFLVRVGAAPREDSGSAGAGRAPAAPSVAVRMRTAESGVLAAADCRAVAESILKHALAPLGATAVAIWTSGPGSSLLLTGHAGFSAEEAGHWHYVPPGVPTPARRALSAREALWLPSLAQSGLPSIGHRRMPDGGRAAVPAETGGRIHGILEICWPKPLDEQPPQIRRQVEALAELVAHTLETKPTTVPGPGSAGPVGGTHADPFPELNELIELVDCLYNPALLLLPQFNAAGDLIDFRVHHANALFADPRGRPHHAIVGGLLLEIYPGAAESGALFEQVERVYATGEPFRSQKVAYTAVVGQVSLPSTADVSISRHSGCVLLIWRTEDEMSRLAGLLEHAQRLGRIGGFEEDLTSGDIIWNSQLRSLFALPPDSPPVPLEQLPGHSHTDDAQTVGRFIRTVLHHRRPSSAAFRLVRPDGIVRHVRIVAEPVLDADQRLTAVRGAYQDISSQHWTEVALAATRDRLADSEQRTAEGDRLAKQLQHAIMPPAHGPVSAPDISVAVRYRPAENEHLVGGDWYDAIVLPSGHVLLSVGDVAGHGISAATGMVALRNALRGLAATGAGPGQILAWLNLVANHFTEQVTATAICALFDPRTRMLKWARAGHLPPVLIRRGVPATVPLVRGLLLGAIDETAYEEGELQLEEDDILLLYTDGLIERKDRALQESLAQLLDTAGHFADTLDQRLDHLLTHSSADTDDDTCIVGIHIIPAAPGSTPSDVPDAPGSTSSDVPDRQAVSAGTDDGRAEGTHDMAAPPADEPGPGPEQAASPSHIDVAEASADYDGHSSSIAAARTFVTDFLRRADPDAPDDRRQHGAAALVTSELVTNVVRHATGPFRLRLAISGHFLEIAVSDRSPEQPLSQPHDPRRIGQHGMEIVLALCQSLRVEPSADTGKTVIAGLALR
jgi:serine phosphatase RsbU (regulator of sigma subunit)/anti-sigma regulatory factor (Ser/Thr protein kinase)